MNNNHLFYAVTRSASETLSSTIFEDRFLPYVFTIKSQCVVILTTTTKKKKKKKKTLMFKFLWLEFRLKSFLELHVHFKDFVCIRMRKLHAECHIQADAHD